MEEWKEYRLGDVLCNKGYIRGPFGSALKRGDLLCEGIPVYEQQHAIYNKRDFRFYISEDKYNEMKRFTVYPDDIIISCSGTVGEVSLIKKNDPKGIISQALLLLRVDNKIISPEFLLYFFKTAKGHNSITSRSSGSVQVNIARREVIEDIPLFIPCIEKQKRIVSILKSLDDKIEVNRKINENLEQQAQALFKSWFVDFEPFKDGEFVESELGMIPKGWRVGILGELCTFKRGKNLLTKNAIEGGVPVVAGGLEPSCYHNVSNTKSPVVTVSGSGANAGFMRMYYQEVWASDCSFIDSTCKNLLFVYCFLAVNRRLLRHAQTGAVQPHVKPSDIHDFNIVIPPQAIIEEFQTKIEESIRLRGNIEKENDSLAELRDTLLPKLMSGELKVFDKPNDQS